MEVSNFELIWKPQSPLSPIGTTEVSRVFQGYFLQITNLENQQYEFLLQFIATSTTDPNRSLEDNALAVVDVPTFDNDFGLLVKLVGSSNVFRLKNRIKIPAKTSALVAVFPSAFNAPPFDPKPLESSNFEVRGYVRLSLPTVRTRTNWTAQSKKPVKVLLTAQNRGTYFDAGGVATGQTQASIPLASASSLVEIQPDKPGFIIPTKPVLPDGILDDLVEVDLWPEIVAEGLARLDTSKTSLDAYNRILAEAGIGITLSAQKASDDK